jgi:hypothetical protein
MPSFAAAGVAFSGAPDFPAALAFPQRRPPPLRRGDDPRQPPGAEAAFLLAGLRWQRRRSGRSLGEQFVWTSALSSVPESFFASVGGYDRGQD